MSADERVLAKVRGWIEKAENDLKNASLALGAGEECPVDTVGFHTQQQEQRMGRIHRYGQRKDCLTLSVPSREDEHTIDRSSLSPTLATLAEALLIGAGRLLELEPGELAAFVRRRPAAEAGDQIVFYETVPGEAGYLEEMAARLPAVAEAAMERLFGHACSKACYLCLKRYGNQRWHPFFDKDAVRDLLLILSRQDPVAPEAAKPGSGLGEACTDARGKALRGGPRGQPLSEARDRGAAPGGP